MSIGEFSQRSGLSLKRLRTYAASGLLIPAAVDAGSGYRYYGPGQLREAHLIDTLRQAGMALADIGELLRNPSRDQLDGWEKSLAEEAVQRQSALEQARRLFWAEPDPPELLEAEPFGDLSMKKLRATSRTETGPVRENNEDAVVSSDRLVAVADGMGGPPGGEIASSMAVSLVHAAFRGRSLEELEAAVRAANRAIFDRVGTISELRGMGTTICAVGLLGDGRLAVVNVGDTRAYLLRQGLVTQLTRDHSVTAALVQRGELTEEEARHHPHRGVLTRALGVAPDVELDSATLVVADDDQLLICTDGLFNELTDEEIAESMTEPRDPAVMVESLVEGAVSRGGHDNISVVVADIRA